MTEIWRGRILWRGYEHPHNHPHTQLKKSGIPHTYTQSMQGFPSKRGQVYLPSLLKQTITNILFTNQNTCLEIIILLHSKTTP